MTDGISASGNMLELFFSDETKCNPLKSEPGAEFNYNIVSPEIASMIITRATEQMAADLGKKLLFEPLGIDEVIWPESVPLHTFGFTPKRGYSRGIGGIVMTTRAMAKIGHLFLNEGLWDKEQILSKEWVRESTREQTTTGLSADYWRNYGFHWRICKFGSHAGYYSYGKSGQSICVIPELRLVTVVTSTDPEAQKVGGKYIDESLLKYLVFVDKYLIGAARKL
jgi:CubicO group peptidase (beta-lactamase class C family)